MASPLKAGGASDNALPAEKLGKAANKAVHDIRYAINDVPHAHETHFDVKTPWANVLQLCWLQLTPQCISELSYLALWLASQFSC